MGSVQLIVYFKSRLTGSANALLILLVLICSERNAQVRYISSESEKYYYVTNCPFLLKGNLICHLLVKNKLIYTNGQWIITTPTETISKVICQKRTFPGCKVQIKSIVLEN